MNYYTINSILKHLDIREDTLLAILSDVTLLLVMDKKK